MKRFLLIVNPVSGKKKAKSALLDVIAAMQKHQATVTVKLTEYRGHAAELSASAKAEGFDAVACFGGDGTLNETICGIMQSGCDLPLGYIPAGSTNDFAASMKLSNVPALAAEYIAKGMEHELDIGLFNNDRFFTYVACIGAFSATSYNVSQGTKNILGHFAYILGGVKEVGKIKSEHIKVQMDDNTVEGDYIFASVTNSTSIAGVVRLKDELVDMSDGLFEVALVKKPKNIIELNRIISAITSSDFSNGQIEFYKSSRVKLIPQGKLDWSLDGEHVESQGEVNIENLHKAVKFLL